MSRRRILGWLVLLVLAALTGYLVATFSTTGDNAPSPNGTEPPRHQTDSSSSIVDGQPESRIAQSRAGDATDDDDGPVRFVVVDIRTGEPIQGAAAFHLRDNRMAGQTGLDGSMSIRRLGLQQLAFAAPGYLTDTWAGRDLEANRIVDGFEKAGCLRIPLRQDACTIPFRLRFLGPDERPATGVAFTIHSLRVPPPAGRLLPMLVRDTADDDLRQAWDRNYQVGLTLGAAAPVPTHFGVDSHSTRFQANDIGEIRFVEPGPYRIQARTENGLVTQQDFEVFSGQSRPFEVRLGIGRFISGVVTRSDNNAPVAGARVLVENDGQTIHIANTGNDGSFRTDPMLNGTYAIRIEHAGYAPARLDRVQPSTTPLRIQVTAVLLLPLRGTVLRRGTATAIADAQVAVEVDDVRLSAVQTDANGRFTTDVPAGEFRIVIVASGFAAYREYVDAGQRPGRFELMPATAVGRVAAGMTALVRGRVTNVDGKPVPRVLIQLTPAQPPQFDSFQAPDGRRIYEGWQIKATNTAFTDERGNYELEWTHSGQVRIRPVRGLARAEEGIAVDLMLGRRRDGVDFVLR